LTRLIETVAEPFADEFLGQFQPDHALAHGEDLGVVAQDRAFHGVAVVGGDGPDAGDLVGRDRHAQAGAADQQRPVGVALGHLPGGVDSKVRVGGGVVGADADVHHGGDAFIGLQQCLQGVLVFHAGLIVADDDAPAFGVSHFVLPFSPLWPRRMLPILAWPVRS
jgi:hypothetical protein